VKLDKLRAKYDFLNEVDEMGKNRKGVTIDTHDAYDAPIGNTSGRNNGSRTRTTKTTL